MIKTAALKYSAPPRLHDSRRSRRGVACVEFAVTLPVIVILVVGIVEIGNALRAGHVLESAVRQSARMVMRDYGDEDAHRGLHRTTRSRLRSFVTAGGMSGSEVRIRFHDAESGALVHLADSRLAGRRVRVEAWLPYSSLQVFPRSFLTASDVRAKMTIRIPEL